MKKFFWLTAIVAGIMLASGQIDLDRYPSESPVAPVTTDSEGPRVEIREVEVPGEISEDCREELRWSAKVTETTRALGKILPRQESIQDKSFQAIITKDWAALNVEKQNQINLMNEADTLRIRLVEQQGRLDDVKGSC